jgi:predicted phage tail protein
MSDIIGHGGGKGGGSSHTHYEATDSLHSTAYARVMDLVSEGEILGLANGVQSVFLNQTPVQNADGTSNFKGVTIDFRPGTQTQDYIPGFPDIESEISVNTELKSGSPWVHAINNTSLSAIRITLGVPALSKADTSNGDILGYQVAYQIELATDGGAYAIVLSNSFNGKTTSLYQRTARIDLPHATSGWQIRVTRLTANANTVGISDTTTIVSYTEVIDAKLRYPMSALVGVQVDATQFQAVPTRAYDLLGRIIQVPSNYDPVARTYSGTWDGTFKPAWSNNPAWVFRDLILNDRYGLGDRITASQVDKWALYKIAQYCDQLVPDGKGGQEPRFTCNLYLQNQKQAYAVLQDIASIFRGISYWGAGAIMASADMPSDPVYIYTAANVIGGKFTRTGSKAATRYTVALVTWNDPADFYTQKTEYVEDPDGIKRYGIKQVQLTGFGCTSQGQAHRAGLWALATSRLETEGISFDVGMDGAMALPGQVVRVADPSRMGRRMGGRIRAVNGRALTLDKAPAVNVGDKLTAILPAGATETHTVASVAGDTVTVDADWSAPPRVQAVWSIDSSELSAPLFRILSVAPKDSSTITVTAVQHEPGKYDYVERGMAITAHSQTSLDVTTQAPPASVTLAGYTVSLNDVQKLALQISCAPVPGAVAYEGAYRRGNDNWVAIPRQASPTMDVRDILAGTYVAKMSAVNSIGITSIETMSVAVAIDKDGGSKNADILLQSDAAYFHTNQAGQTDPSVITITASLLALAGAVSWSCVGGKLTNTTATTAQLAFTDMTSASATVTANLTMFGRTYTKSVKIGKVQDGAAGQDGLKTAIARLFQWAPTAPAKPTGTSTFTWPGTNSGYTGNDGWANPAPGNPGTPGWRLFSASVALQAALAATTSSVSYGNAVIEDGAQNGATGADGLKTRLVTVYRWDVSLPAGPTGPATLKWSDSTFGAAPTNWTLTPGSAPSLGMTLFAATYQVTDTASKASTDFNWQSASVMAIGYVGTNGGKGDTGGQGASYVTAYCATTVGTGTSAPAATKGKTSLPAANSGGLTGTYSASVPTLTAGQYQMQTDGIYDPTTDMITWSIPYQSALKVATLSAITANLGNITGGSLNLGNGTFTVDNSGNLVCHSIIIYNPDGTIMLQAGGKLNVANAAPGTVNQDLVPSINSAATTAQWSNIAGQANAPASGATVGATWGTNIGGQPDDTTNLVNKTSFDDGTIGKWSGSAVAVTGQIFSKALQVVNRDNYENSKFPVVPGETLFVSAWLDASTAGYTVAFGCHYMDATGADVTNGAWNGSSQLAKGASWAAVSSSQVVPANAAFAQAWFQIGGNQSATDKGTARGSRFRISRSQAGATVGAPTGTMVGGTEAGLLAGRALNGDSAYTAINDATNGLAQRMRSNAANILSGPGGLVAGTLTYDGNGNRISGYGVAVNQKGFVAFDPNGVATFTLDAATGASTMRSVTILGPDGSVVFSSGAAISVNQNIVPRLSSWPSGNRYGGSFIYYDTSYAALNGENGILPPTPAGGYSGIESDSLHIAAGEWYTVSFSAVAENANAGSMWVDIFGGATSQGTVDTTGTLVSPPSWNDPITANNGKRFSFTEQMPSNGDGNARIRFFNNSSSVKVRFWDVKVERGKKVTAWCENVITSANASSFFQPGALDITYINKASINTLSALSAYLGAVDIGAGGHIASGQTGLDAGLGLWIGGSSTPGFSIAAANGAKLVFDPNAASPLKIVGADMSANAIGVSLYTNSGGTVSTYSRNATQASTLSAQVNITNGSGNYSYSWTANSTYAATVSTATGINCAGLMKGPGAVVDVDVTLTVTVTDNVKQVSKAASITLTISFT